jgi:hypothetical protein
VEHSPGKKPPAKPGGHEHLDFTPDPRIAALLSAGEESADLVFLTGFLGPSKRPEYVRLYVDLDLSCYFEIPKSAFAYTGPINSADETQPRKFAIFATTKLEFVQHIPASFLQGPITSSLPLAAAGGAPVHGTTAACLKCGTPAGGGGVSTKGDIVLKP